MFRLGLAKNLNYTGVGSYGFDTVGLGLPNGGGAVLEHQIVAGKKCGTMPTTCRSIPDNAN